MSNDLSIEGAHLARSVLRLMRPYDLLGAPLIRLGRAFDGGYVMVDAFEGVEAAYSLGINDDVSWDFDIAQRGIDIFQYDHTIEQLPFEHTRFNWSRRGISHVAEGELDTLENLIAENGHRQAKNMLLKCDIEGSEWLALAYAPSQALSQFSQIVLELHRLGDLHLPASAHIARQALLNLTASHHVVHVHGNNFGSFSVVGGIPVPDVLELTLARKDLGRFAPSTKVFPTELDMPCHSRSADLYLGRFEF